MRILIVDDSAAHRKTAKQQLKTHDLTIVGTYEEAERLLKETSLEKNPKFDAMLTDLMLPGPGGAAGGTKFVGEEMPIAKEADTSQRRFRDLGSVHAAYLMGSFVQDGSNEVDIFIVGDINRTKLQRLVKELEEEEGRELNYTTMTKTEYDYRIDINDRFLADVLRAKKSAVIEESSESKGKVHGN